MANEYYQLDLGLNCAGQFAMCVFHYVIADPTNPNEFEVAGQLVTALETGGPPVSWISKLQVILSNEAFISSARAKRVAPTGGNTAGQAFLPTDFPGDELSPIHTQQIAAVVIWPNDTEADAFGRNFIPGIPESALVAGRWEGPFQTLVDAFITKHVVGHTVAAGIFLPVVFNRTTHLGDVINAGYLSPKVGTQRRREVPV